MRMSAVAGREYGRLNYGGGVIEPTLAMPAPPRRRWRTALFIVGLSVMGCCVAGVTATVVRSALDSAGGSDGTGAATAEPAGFGDPVRDGQFEFVVSALACGESELVTGILRAKAQGQYCVVELRVTNIGDEPRHFADGLQRAYSPEGDEYAADTHAGVVANGSGAAVWNVINPGNTVQAKVVFDIPAGASIAAVELHDSALSGGVRVAVAAA